MIILLMGPTASGKTTLLNALCKAHSSYVPALRETTRAMRDIETPGVDYNFISVSEFKDLINTGQLVEYEEYSDNRFYGTKLTTLLSAPIVCSTITPSGFLQLCSFGLDFGKILLVNCKCSLKTQIIRYVSRISDFKVSDKMEMCDRLARDEGMFKGIDAIINSGKNIYSGEILSITVDTENSVYDICKYIDSVVESLASYQ